MTRRLLSLLLVVMLLCAPFSGAQALSGMEVTFLKVGKADAILITSSESAVLIDAAEDDDGPKIVDFLAKKGIDALDMLIITHYDKDHVGGADYVLDGVDVKVVYDADYTADSKQYRQYLSALRATDTPRYRVTEEMTITLGELTYTLLPTGLRTDDDNDNSLVVSLTDGLHSFLFAADADEARIEELLADGIGPHDVLKMPHHGRDKENLPALLDAVQPQIAVIMDSEKNPADDAVLALLEARGIFTYSTSEDDVRVLSGASGLTVLP